MTTLALDDCDFDRIRDIMYQAIGLSFNDSKKSLIHSRLAPRIAKLGLGGFSDYIDILEEGADAAEFQTAIDVLTTNETYFFREPKHYELLEGELCKLGGKQTIAVWSAAASFGDEAYSTAMLMSDLQLAGKIGPDWSILATDINRVLLGAKEAIYPQDRLRAVSPQQLSRYCLRGHGEAEGHVQLQEELRARVQFGQLNLCKPFDGLGLFDVVFLRNVLIYFDAATKADVVDRVLACVKPGGLFFLGTAEGRVSGRASVTALIPGAFRKVVKP